MGDAILKQYKVTVDRDTSQFIELLIGALDEADATNKAMDVAQDERTEWQESDFLGDAVVSLIECVEGKEGEEVYNVHDELPKTNIQIVTDIMNNSKYGVLAQVFVIDALVKFSKLVIDASPEQIKSFENSIVNAEAWQGVAKEIDGKLVRFNQS